MCIDDRGVGVDRIQNPLADIPDDLLMRDVEDFAQEKGLTDVVDLLKKGARVAKDPANFDSIEELTEEERNALRYEGDHKWSHPLALYLTIIICSIGAAVQ